MGLLLSLLLIVFGTVMLIRVFTEYGQVFTRTQDDYLLHLVQSIDRNISNLLDRCEDSMDYLTAQEEFAAAQAHWQESGDSAPLLKQLDESALRRDELIASIVVFHHGKGLLSTDGTLEYTFLSTPPSSLLRPCTDPEGSLYLAITHEEGDLLYAALLDLDCFYGQLASPDFYDHNWILLTDTHSQVLLYQQQKHAYVDRVDAVSGATSGQEGVELLLKNQQEQRSGMASYEYFDADTRENYTARMAVVPSEQSENGAFAIGVVCNYEEEAAALNSALLRLLLFGSLLMLGILLLVLQLLFANRKDERQLALLRQKNEQVESLNRKMQDLAHHQRLETIGTLTSSIAHEFNNLLTPIMGYSIMSLETLPPEEEEVYDNLLEIYQASQKAKTIISRLSDLSRKNTGLSYQYLSPDDLCRKVLDVANPARPPRVEVRLDTNTSGFYLHGNETQLTQLLLNLVLNGFHAMEKDGGILLLSTFSRGERIFLQVSDTGCGIPPEILPRIFEPFFTTKEGGKGTGLGLPIVRQIAEEHKGSVEVQSEPGKGTTFLISLPLHLHPDSPEFD